MTSDRLLLSQLTAKIVSAFVSSNSIQVDDVPGLVRSVSSSLAGMSFDPGKSSDRRREPAVNPKRSVQKDYIVCLEDGKRFKSLKRHLAVHYGLTPEEYRRKWGLPADYPMVAPNYAAARSELAKKMGLGRTAGWGRKAKPK